MNRLLPSIAIVMGLAGMPAPAPATPSAFGPSRPLPSAVASSVQADMNARDAALVGWTGAGSRVEVAFRPPAGPFGPPVVAGVGTLEGLAMADRGARGLVIREAYGEIRATSVSRARVLDDDLIRLPLLSGVTPRVIGVRITPDGAAVLAVALEARNEWRLQTHRREGGSWERFGRDLVVPGQPQPRAAMDSRGGLSVAWVDDDDTIGSATVRVSQRPGDAELWSSPSTLASIDPESARPFVTAIAMNERGDTAVGITILPVEPDGRTRGFVALRPVAAAAWGLTADLPSVAGVAVTPAGGVWAAYRQAVVGTSGDEVALATPLDRTTRRWRTPEPLDQYGAADRRPATGPNLVALADGRLVAFWSADATSTTTFGAVHDSRGGWTPATEFGGVSAQVAGGASRGIVAAVGTGRTTDVRVTMISSALTAGR